MLPEISDETMGEILTLYEIGCDEDEIARIVRVPLWDVCCVIDADAAEYPDEPLRERVLN